MPKFKTLDELVDFFETADLGDYLEQMPEVHFDIDIKRTTHIVTLDDDVAERVTAMARARQVPSEALINVWLREKLSEQTQATA